jgi:hypothetical protein
LRLESLSNILPDEKMALSLTIAASPRQRSHSQVRVQRYSWPQFAVSDSRLPCPRIYIPRSRVARLYPQALSSFSSPPTTCRATVEYSTRLHAEERTLSVTSKRLLCSPRHLLDLEIGSPSRRQEGSAFQCRRLTKQNSGPPPLSQIKAGFSFWYVMPTISRPVSHGVKPLMGPKTRFLLLSDSCGFLDVGRPPWWEEESVFTIVAAAIQCSHFSSQVPRESWSYCIVSDSTLPQPGGPGPRMYNPQEQDFPVISTNNGFPFRRLLPLAGQRWRCSNPPPHGRWIYFVLNLYLMLRADRRENTKSESKSYSTTDGQ